MYKIVKSKKKNRQSIQNINISNFIKYDWNRKYNSEMFKNILNTRIKAECKWTTVLYSNLSYAYVKFYL